LATRNRKKTPVLRKQKSIRKNKTQLAKKRLEAEIIAVANNSKAETN
jgi:hypothetical protein